MIFTVIHTPPPVDLVDTLHHIYNVQFVAVLQILHRIPAKCRVRYPVDTVWFNERVDETNLKLDAMLRSMRGTCLWRHKGFWAPSTQLEVFCADGVHLSAAGLKRYYNSLRAVVVSVLKHL